jgi:hypothetical protein
MPSNGKRSFIYVEVCSGSSRLVTPHNIFATLDNDLPRHCECRLVDTWQSHFQLSLLRLLRRYAPRNDERERLFSLLEMCH